MQTKSPLMDELAKITTAAMGLAQAASEEAKTAFRAQGDRLVAEFDLVRRDEFDALKAEIASLRAELAALKGGKPAAKAAPKPAAAPRKTASTKPKAKPKG